MVLYNMHKSNKCKSVYIENIENILNTCGFSGIWQTQDVINPKWLTLAVKQTLKDHYLQNWYSLYSLVNNTASSGKNYKIFKEEFEQSKYVTSLSNMYREIFMIFRTRNTKIPVEVGRWNSTPLDERTCAFCRKDVGDEYHYILSCEHLKISDQNILSHIIWQDLTHRNLESL